ncbi:Cystatin domain containing protein [Trema orientale]|uniref:Cystatin domain containing protein n=1 Tax=Trema orientale TaxID=63057 RepID=A0A2P5FR19_TREOI|nr:Cystatin domain containing protein [Trema orientale]
MSSNAPTALPPYAPDAPLPEAIAPPEAPVYRREAIDYATIEPGAPAPVYRREPIVIAPIEPWPVDLQVPKYQSPYAPDVPLLVTKTSLGAPATTMSGLGAIDSSSPSTNPLDPSDPPSPNTLIQKLRLAELELAEVEPILDRPSHPLETDSSLVSPISDVPSPPLETDSSLFSGSHDGGTDTEIDSEIEREGFYAGEWKMDELFYVIGGIHPISLYNEIAIHAARHALYIWNKEKGIDLCFRRLVRGNTQMVNGYFYYLTFEASDDCYYEAKVFIGADLVERKVLFMRPAVHHPQFQYPEGFDLDAVRPISPPWGYSSSDEDEDEDEDDDFTG